jgi:hypothetical protein
LLPVQPKRSCPLMLKKRAVIRFPHSPFMAHEHRRDSRGEQERDLQNSRALQSLSCVVFLDPVATLRVFASTSTASTIRRQYSPRGLNGITHSVQA